MSAVWSWADVPWSESPASHQPRAPRVTPPRPYRRWPLLWLAEGEHAAVPTGATLAHVRSVTSTMARRRDMRFVIHVTAAGLFVRRVPLGDMGCGTETVWEPAPASSRLVTSADRMP